MIKIFSNIIPFKGFLAMTIWPLCFIRKDMRDKFNEVSERHEDIHAMQQQEVTAVALMIFAIVFLGTMSWWAMLILPLYFYWYLIEWLIRLVFCSGNAYRRIAFEREAYAHDDEETYLADRQPYAWIKYLFH